MLVFHAADARVTFDVSIEEMPGTQLEGLPPFSDFHDAITRHVLAAGAQWAQYLVGTAVVSVRVALYPQGDLPADNAQLLADTPNTFRGRTATVRVDNGVDIVEFAPAFRIRTGRAIDSSGEPDVTIRVGEQYLKTMLYFDPDPFNRTGPVPPDRTEAFGRFVHELGHALGMNGFYRGDGTFDSTSMLSTFDHFIAVDPSGNSSFTGPLSMQLYSGPVPLTPNQRGHLGSDADPRLFSIEAAEAMNGKTVYNGTRYDVSELDVRILCDIGVPCVLNGGTPTPVSTPVDTPTPEVAVEYYNASMDHYFVTAIADEVTKLDNGVIGGWARTGASFHVFPVGTTGAASVCRFFSASFAPKSSHFYTPFESECATVRNNADWQFEAKVFSVALPDPNGNCASALIPLYRLYNNGLGGAPNHRYTTASDIRSTMIGRGWIPEGMGALGVVACVPQ